MRMTQRGQITIPKDLRERFGLNHNVEIEIIPMNQGILIQKRQTMEHPVDRIYGILGHGGNTDDYIEEIRGT